MKNNLSPPLNDVGHDLVVWKVDFAVEDDKIAGHGSDVVSLGRVRRVAGSCKERKKGFNVRKTIADTLAR